MRERDINAKKFHRGHYEIIAGRFREALEPYMLSTLDPATIAESTDPGTMAARISGGRNALVNLALSMAVRFQADNEDFDPDIFLTRCSPDPENYPLAELWIGFVEKHQHSMKVED